MIILTRQISKNNSKKLSIGEDGALVIPEGYISIGKEAFSKNKELKNVSLPSTMKKIGIGAFFACSNLTSIKRSLLVQI